MKELDNYDRRLIEQAEGEGMWDRRRPKSYQTIMIPGTTSDLVEQSAQERATSEGMPERKTG